MNTKNKTEETSSNSKSWFHIFDYTDVLISLFMAGWCLRIWMFPKLEDAEDMYRLSALLAFEFIMLHSGTFMAFVKPKWSLLVFVPAYGLFAWAFTFAVGDSFIMWIYLLAVFNRMRFAFINKDNGLRNRMFKSSFISGFIYVIILGITLFLSDYLPAFGLTEDFLEQANPKDMIFLGGPVFVMGFGLIYYTVLAIFEFWLARNPEKLTKDM